MIETCHRRRGNQTCRCRGCARSATPRSPASSHRRRLVLSPRWQSRAVACQQERVQRLHASHASVLPAPLLTSSKSAMRTVDAERLVAAPCVNRHSIATGGAGVDLESITTLNAQHRPPRGELFRIGDHGDLLVSHLTDRRRWPPSARGVYKQRRPPAVVDRHHGYDQRALRE